jgi:hypothetical protein
MRSLAWHRNSTLPLESSSTLSLPRDRHCWGSQESETLGCSSLPTWPLAAFLWDPCWLLLSPILAFGSENPVQFHQ